MTLNEIFPVVWKFQAQIFFLFYLELQQHKFLNLTLMMALGKVLFQFFFSGQNGSKMKFFELYGKLILITCLISLRKFSSA